MRKLVKDYFLRLAFSKCRFEILTQAKAAWVGNPPLADDFGAVELSPVPGVATTKSDSLTCLQRWGGDIIGEYKAKVNHYAREVPEMKTAAWSTALALLCVLLGGSRGFAQQDVDLNVELEKSTFMIKGPSRTQPGGVSSGTIFLVGRPLKSSPNSSRNVLITAAHVLNDLGGEYAQVDLRRLKNDGNWEVVPTRLRIRSGETPLWKQNPGADVAAMYVRIPADMSPPAIVATDAFADDETLRRYQINPGTELNCLGYPLGAASDEGEFAILRSGKIASYPLLPSAQKKTFLFDFRVFKGNSGGPVYFSQSPLRGPFSSGIGAQFLMGLVTEEKFVQQVVQLPYEVRASELQLSIGVVVHAALLKETVNSLPDPDTPESNSATQTLEPIPHS